MGEGVQGDGAGVVANLYDDVDAGIGVSNGTVVLADGFAVEEPDCEPDCEPDFEPDFEDEVFEPVGVGVGVGGDVNSSSPWLSSGPMLVCVHPEVFVVVSFCCRRPQPVSVREYLSVHDVVGEVVTCLPKSVQEM